MIKKNLLILLLLIVCSIGTLFIWRYVNYARDKDPYKTFLLPRVEMSMAEISSLTAEKTEMTANVLIKNQFPFSFTADSFQYQLYINDAQIMKSRYKKSITLAANDSSWVALPITVFNHEVDSVIKANEKRDIDSVEYRMNASFFTDVIFKKHFDVTIKRFLPLVHIPILNVEHVEVDSLNFKRAAIIVHTTIINKNVFDIKLKDYAYQVQIEDHEWVKGNVKGLTNIKAHAITDIDIPVTLSFKEVGKTLFALLKKGKNVNYKLKLDLKVASDQNMMKESKVIIVSTGTVKSVLKTVKGEPKEKK